MNDHLAFCLKIWRLLTDNGVWGVGPRAAQLPHDWVVEAADGAQLEEEGIAPVQNACLLDAYT